MSDSVKMTSLTFKKDYIKPDEEKDRMLGYIKWGKKNDYPYFLIDLYNGSAWHQGIIKNKTYYIAGGGLEVISGNMQPFIENKYAEFDMNEIAEMLCNDYEMFGGFCAIGTWNRDASRVAVWEHIDLDSVRVDESERMYYISDDWTAMQQSAEKTNLRAIPALDMTNKTGKFIIYYKDPVKKTKKEKGIYPKPPYYGGITAIQTDVDISRFHMHEIANSFKGGTMISFTDGYPETQEEAENIKAQVKGRSQSVEDAGEIVITFSDTKDKAPIVQSLNGNDLDKRYETTENSVQQNILVAHSVVAPSLFGVAPDGSFNAAETADLYEIFKKTYVESRQKRIEWMINYMAELSGFVGKLKLKDVAPIGAEQSAAQAPTTPGDIPTNETQVDVAKSALNGAQIASLIDVVAKIKEGLLTSESALSIVLASFPTIDESQARRIVGLQPSGAQQMSSCNQGHAFSDDEIGYFAEYGDPANNFDTVMSFSIPWDTPMEEVFKRQEQIFATIGTINVSGEGSKGLGKPKGGIDSQYEVRYRYQEVPGIPPVKTQSRNFCIKLLQLNRLYTREEIETISIKLGRDVWRYRGGWYHNPETGKTTPWCRHEWAQQVVIARAGQGAPEIEVSQVKTDGITITTSQEGVDKAIEFFKDLTGVQMRIGNVAENIDPQKMQISLNEANKILREYKVTNTILNNAEMSFKTTAGAYGFIRHRGGEISEINLGQNAKLQGKINTDPTKRFEIVKGKFDPSREYLTQKRDPHIDEANLDKYVATHEMAHVIAVSQSPNSGAYFGKLKTLFTQYKRELKQSVIDKNIDNLNEISLGSYASTNMNEFHAEAFSEYRLSSSPGKYAKLVGNLIDQHFKK